jgi:ABC-type dipeptide/oligopeptide/nickel transport system ATPase component
MTAITTRTDEGPTDQELLRVEDLHTQIFLRSGVVQAVNGVTFSIRKGESVALVGESGSGKTMTCLSIMRLLPVSAARVVGGEAWFEGRDLLRLRDSEMRRIRGRRMAIVMQDPLSALNPVLNVGYQVGEPLRYHSSMSRGDRLERVLDVLRAVRIPRPADRLGDFPHQFSGGMRQRIVAAMGLGPSPSL